MSQEALGRPPLTSAEKNPVKEAVDSTGLLDSNKESTEGILNSVAPEGINNGLKSLLGNVNVENLLVGLKVEKVTVENMTSTMTDDGILVFAKTTAFIGGEGLAGPVIGILGFQVHSEVILKIGISTNNTQCVDLQVQDKDIEVKEVNMQLVKGITESLPVSLPLTLEDTVSQLLTVTMSKNIKESKSCDIELSDVNECKNSTGLFNYHVESSRISAEGLSIFYCAHFRQNTSPVPGRLLPPDPKNANISLTFSGEMLKQIVAQSAKQSSVMMNNLAATITNVVYNHQPGNKIHVTYWVALKKDGRNFAIGETELIVSHACKILKDKMRADVNIVRYCLQIPLDIYQFRKQYQEPNSNHMRRAMEKAHGKYSDNFTRKSQVLLIYCYLPLNLLSPLYLTFYMWI
ncbi:vomeromodulin-like isoform X1 [Sus scrofa]|uniref:vomeromodulin-like isoform X1 n=1 Tax=Sus scrofa TaxID=9823 RepID=UPI000A2B131B|nr:vomeromodulin-like isoform X1 [Sus scrofa]